MKWDWRQTEEIKLRNDSEFDWQAAQKEDMKVLEPSISQWFSEVDPEVIITSCVNGFMIKITGMFDDKWRMRTFVVETPSQLAELINKHREFYIEHQN